MLRHWIACVVILGSHLALFADVDSGPKAGEKVEDFKVFGVTGPVEGKEVSYVQDRKDEPTIYLFVQHDKFDRPMARFMKAIDVDSKEVNDKTKVIAVWLTEKADDAKQHLPRVNMSLQFVNTALTVFDGRSGPNGWSLNGDAHLTVVIASKGKVVKSFAYLSVNETDAPKVKEAVKKLVDGK